MSREFPVIIADESVDARIVKSLSENGYAIYSVMSESPGISDLQVIQIAIEKNGFVITEDKDFGDELVYKRIHDLGSLLLRISDLPIEARIALVIQTISAHGQTMNNRFAVLTSKKLRIRKYS